MEVLCIKFVYVMQLYFWAWHAYGCVYVLGFQH